MFKIRSIVEQQTGQRHVLSEDRFICIDILDPDFPELSLYAVLDGHGDEHAAAFVENCLPKYLKQAEGFAEKKYVTAVRDCIQRLHTELVNDALSKGGTTLSLALVDRRRSEGQTILAFLGDSPIFVRRRHVLRDDVYLAFPLHNSSNPAVALRNCPNQVATAPWESRRHPRGINLFASLGDALYEPTIANLYFKRACEMKINSNDLAWIKGDSEQLFKSELEKSLPADSPARKHAVLHTPKTLGYYLSDRAFLLDECPLQREPDIMSMPTCEIDIITLGSDGAFPQSCFDKIMTVIRKVADLSSDDALPRLTKQLMPNEGRDDKTVLAITISDCDDA